MPSKQGQRSCRSIGIANDRIRGIAAARSWRRHIPSNYSITIGPTIVADPGGGLTVNAS